MLIIEAVVEPLTTRRDQQSDSNKRKQIDIELEYTVKLLVAKPFRLLDSIV